MRFGAEAPRLLPVRYVFQRTQGSGVLQGPFQAVGIGASWGGLEAMRQLLRHVPPDFPAPIALVQHLRRDRPSPFAQLLRAYTPLTVKYAEEGEPFAAGTVYIAPPDYHLVVTEAQTLTLPRTARVSHARPAVTPLFLSLAQVFGRTALGVILSGNLDDGAVGVRAIKDRGGTILVQDEATAKSYGMPGAAVATGCVDFILPLGTIGQALHTLVAVPGTASLFAIRQDRVPQPA